MKRKKKKKWRKEKEKVRSASTAGLENPYPEASRWDGTEVHARKERRKLCKLFHGLFSRNVRGIVNVASVWFIRINIFRMRRERAPPLYT